MILKQTSPPSAEPVDLALAKAHLRVDGPDDDLLIGQIISSARQWCENFQNRAYVTQTWRKTLNVFPPNDIPIALPRPPLQSVASITYTDTDGVSQTLAASKYVVDTDSEPGRVYLAYGEEWPDTQDIPNAVQITYRAGYATPFTAAIATDVLTVKGRTFTDGDCVRLSNSGGELPAGLDTGVDYYVVNASGSTLKLSATLGGSAVDITAAGSGTHFIGSVPENIRQAILLLIANYYDQRSPVVTGTIGTALQFSLSSLLWQDRVGVIG